MKIQNVLIHIDFEVIKNKFNINRLKYPKKFTFSGILEDCEEGDNVFVRFFNDDRKLLKESIHKIPSKKYILKESFSIKKDIKKKNAGVDLDVVYLKNGKYDLEIFSENLNEIIYSKKIKFVKPLIGKIFKSLFLAIFICSILILLNPNIGVQRFIEESKTYPEFNESLEILGKHSTANLMFKNYFNNEVIVKIFLEDATDENNLIFTSSILKRFDCLQNIYFNRTLDEGVHNLILITYKMNTDGTLEKVLEEDLIVNVKE